MLPALIRACNEQIARIVGGSYQLAAVEAAETAAQFARLVCDPFELTEIREFAYVSLFHVSGKPFGQWPVNLERPLLLDVRIPDDIDWSFVRSYLK